MNKALCKYSSDDNPPVIKILNQVQEDDHGSPFATSVNR